MAKIVQLDAYRRALTQKVRKQLDVLGVEVVSKDQIELVIDDGGEIRVLRCSRTGIKTTLTEWVCETKSLEQVIEEVISEPEDPIPS